MSDEDFLSVLSPTSFQKKLISVFAESLLEGKDQPEKVDNIFKELLQVFDEDNDSLPMTKKEFKERIFLSKAEFDKTQRLPTDLVPYLRSLSEPPLQRRCSEPHAASPLVGLDPPQGGQLSIFLFSVLQTYTIDRFGSATWEKARDDSHQPEETLLLSDTIHDEIFLSAVSSLTTNCQISSEEIMSDLGFFFSQYALKEKPALSKYMEMFGPTFGKAVESVVPFHIQIKEKFFPALSVPDILVHENRAGFVKFSYLPSNPLRECFREFIIGHLKYLAQEVYHLNLEVIQVSDDPNRKGAMIYTVTWRVDDDDETPTQLPKSLGINGETFDSLFPFHFVIDNLGKLIQIGKSLSKLIPTLELAQSVRPYISVTEPPECSGGIPFESLKTTHLNSVIMLSCRRALTTHTTFTMKGQFVVPSKKKRFLAFCGTPMFHTSEEFTKSGLTVADFASHDNSIRTSLFLWNIQEDETQPKQKESKSTTGKLQSLFGNKTFKKEKRRDGRGRRMSSARAQILSDESSGDDEESYIISVNCERPISPLSNMTLPPAYPERLSNFLRESLLSSRFDDYSLIRSMVNALSDRLESQELSPFLAAILGFFKAHHEETSLLRELLKKEIQAKIPLLRSDSAAVRLVGCYLVEELSPWCGKCLSGLLKAFRNVKKEKGLDSEAISQHVTQILEKMRSLSSLIPQNVACLLRWVVSSTHQVDATMAVPIIGNLVILRSMNVILLNPSTLDRGPWNQFQLKSIVKVTKLLTSAATRQTENFEGGSSNGKITEEEEKWAGIFREFVQSVISGSPTTKNPNTTTNKKTGLFDQGVRTCLATIRDYFIRYLDLLWENKGLEKLLRQMTQISLSSISLTQVDSGRLG